MENRNIQTQLLDCVNKVTQVQSNLENISAGLVVLQEALHSNTGFDSYYPLAVQGIENMLNYQITILRTLLIKIDK